MSDCTSCSQLYDRDRKGVFGSRVRDVSIASGVLPVRQDVVGPETALFAGSGS